MKNLYHITALTAITALLTSCALFEGEKKDPPKPEDRYAFLKNEKPIENTEHKTETMEQEEVRFKDAATENTHAEQLKELSFPKGKPQLAAKERRSTEAPRFFDDLILTNGDEELTVSLVFNSAPLVDVVPAFADVLGFNFIVDSTIKSTVTLNLNAKMTRRELWNTFDRMLFVANTGATVEDSLVRITPLSQLSRQPGGNGEIYYYAFQNSTAKEVVNQIRPFLGNGSVCVELTRPNAILICDEQSNMPKIKSLITAIDQNGRSNWPREPIKCNYVLPSKLALELQAILPVLGFTVTKQNEKNAPPGAIQVIGVDRLGLLIVSAATQEALQEVRKWVAIFDSSESVDQERVFVYKVTHGKARQLAEALSVIYNTTGASLTVDTSSGNNRTTQLNSSNRNRTTTNRNTNNRNDINSDVSASLFENNVRVFADGVLNRLVIRTTPRTYASIKALLDRLDVVPSQVLLQVLVVEVTLNESTKFGIEFSAAGNGNDLTTLLGTNYSELNGFTAAADGALTPTPIPNADNGFSLMLANPSNPQEKFGYLKALAGNTDIKVISSPQLLVSSHKEAVIQVGDKIPYLKQGTSDTSSNGTVLQNYDYEDTGVILTVTPQITSTDLIALEIKQELSSAVKTTSSNINSPTFSKRIVETAMTIANGRTMILGGLIQEKKNDYLDTLPIINQIPLLRRLFGNTNASIERSEILVLITGYIVNEKSPVEEMIKRYNDAIRSLNTFDKDIAERSKPENQGKRMLKNGEFWK